MKISCIGEVLMDHFPSGKIAGGAPMNVAVWLRKLGVDSYLISKVGVDDDGSYLKKFLLLNQLSTAYIDTDDDLPTGFVKVLLREGSATYHIHHPVAWDRISISEDKIALVERSDALVFGSLASRDHRSQTAIVELMKYAKYKVFDINLRPPHYSNELLDQYIRASDLVKFNDEEIYEMGAYYGISKNKSLDYHITAISEETNTPSICVTKGSHGAVLMHKEEMFHFAGYRIQVKDTVGAGDSFLAGMLSQLLANDKDPAFALRYGCAIGAFVASQNGANPDFNPVYFKEKFHL
jgi:fructokinase